jgi:hypothetical protein
MVEHIRRTYGSHLRIAIVDTDAHHGDGTQDIFYNDPGILHISLHQDGRTLYPGTGFINERGGPAAYGQTVNVPLPPGTGDEGVLYVIKNLVLPILEDFEPDLVINAAGQDNHYTDPLTNMRVTAQGYARLTELLSPDIVVLEGGYSIEGALPYVNAGLLLALAGMDYSAAREPDWLEEKVKQPLHISETIEKLVAQVWELWRTRKDVNLEKIFGRGPFFQRHRRVYYDTDNITEEQVEKIKLCSACSGWRVIQSGAVRGYGGSLGRATVIAAVLLPWHVCPDCRREAEAEFQGAQKIGRFRYVYLQDVERDIYKCV